MRLFVFKNKKAFTLSELVISFSVLALMSILTVVTLLSSSERERTQAMIASQGFYESVGSLYLQVTSLSDNPVKIKKTTSVVTPEEPDENQESGNTDSDELYNAMLKYLDFISANIDCNEVNFDSFEADKCVKLTSGIKMGIKVNSKCDSTLDVYEFLKNDDKDLNVNSIQTRNVTNACGYIIYRTRGSKGIFKEDAFVIPLGTRKFK